MTDVSRLLTASLILANQVLAATIVLTSFSLLIYLLTHNFRSAVARAFCAILFFVLVVYVGDVALVEVNTQVAAVHWLKFQWVGIAMVPAAYLDFSSALLRTTHARARGLRIVVPLSYGVSLAVLGLVYFSDLMVYDGVYSAGSSHLAAGPLFWAFVLFFVATVLWGADNIRRARGRCLTRASRRRMTYLGLAFAAPALGVFPYLMLESITPPVPENAALLLLTFGTLAILLMLVLMAYSVAYFGALTPDRVIRHSLIHYLLRGPLVGAAVIFTMLAVPKVQQILGLPRDTVLIFAVVGVIVALQLLINRAKPFIDRAIYRQDRDEIAWIQTLDRRLLTSGDLNSFLENVLAALCDLLQVRTGFVAVWTGTQLRLEAHCGERTRVQEFLEVHDPSVLAALPAEHAEQGGFVASNGFWLTPLRGRGNEVWLGVLGLEARRPEPDLKPDEVRVAKLLIGRAQEALEDRHLQQSVFETLRRILPNIELLHRWQDTAQYTGVRPVPALLETPIHSPEFQKWTRDALSQYWGGPKLSESPLMGLRIVREAVRDRGAAPIHALQSVLHQAIESLRPPGEQKMTANEWLLYNILEMKFIRGLKVQDIARRLAMSESDLYRKQRVAIAEVAKSLAILEQDSANHVEREASPSLAERGASGMVQGTDAVVWEEVRLPDGQKPVAATSGQKNRLDKPA